VAWRKGRAPEPPRGPVVHLRHALHLVLAGELAAAEQELADAAREDPSVVDVYLALANLLRARGDIGRAIQIHQNLLLRPDLPEDVHREALLGLALDFRVGGFLQRAAASFEDLLEIDPENQQALRELERIRVDAGEWEDAIRIRKRIGRADPRSPQVLAHLWVGQGRLRLQEGREGDARRAFRKAFSSDRGCAEAYLALGDLTLRQGKPKKAIGNWIRTLDLHPAIGLLSYPRLWEGHAAIGEMGKLEALLAGRVEKDPDDREAAVWLARVRVRDGRVDEGVAVLRQTLSRDPGFLGAHAEIGRILLREHRDPEALKTFEELLDRLPLERSQLRCRNCGTHDVNLHWRCPQCGEWDSFV
jgi:lipopolysaccharide biosynthesis regulator YciM